MSGELVREVTGLAFVRNPDCHYRFFVSATQLADAKSRKKEVAAFPIGLCRFGRGLWIWPQWAISHFLHTVV